ncbi:queuosine precursor transporter [Ciceribacter sp. L1K23]|uniref:queuosine precursor transporter n=1 Tax=Ciceribacter sp. L1K23 TaxID=2820276 RepID=UPI001B819400|nr:queuosine precursor transporter [Ciceribacter sp. L1K23]MBR0554232.1 queuosine precursor transporter [Ciceribacter sp. L1K23]
MQMIRYFIAYSIVMTAVVVASNILVQYPVDAMFAGINLADLLTYGAFTYPIAFLVTDLTNRQFGPSIARRVVFVGFLVGVTLSFATSSPRIAIASGTAYLAGQLLDVSVFNRLRQLSWWKAPLLGSVFGSILDTVIFFSLSFAPAFVMLGANDDFAIEWAPILGVFATEAPRWMSWALGDFAVKMIVGLVMLLPYGALMNSLKPMPSSQAA